MRSPPLGREGFAFWSFVAGSILLASALLFPWYTITGTNTDGSGTVTESFSAVSAHTEATWPEPPPSATVGWTEGWLPATGTLYLAVTAIVLAGVAFGIVAVGVLSSKRGRIGLKIGLAVSLTAVALTIFAPVLIVAEQPSAVCSDARNFSPPLGGPPPNRTTPLPSCTWEFRFGDHSWNSPGAASGPQATFVGSEPGNVESLSWGPAIGWYLAIAGVLFFAVGTLVEWSLLRREPPMPPAKPREAQRVAQRGSPPD